MNTNNDPRVPRPLGLTFTLMALNANAQDKTEKLAKIKNTIIDQWTNNNLMLNGRYYNIQEMAAYLSMTESSIMIRMNKAMERLGKVLNSQDAGTLARAIFFQAQKIASESTALIAEQAHTLRRAQDGEYKPFISATYNQALELLVKANKPFMEMLNLLKPSGASGVHPLAGTQDQANQNPKQYLGPDEALRIINAELPSLLSLPEAVEAKEAELVGQENIPNVNAKTQDLTSIGIKNAEHTPIPNKAKRHRKDPQLPRYSNDVIVPPSGKASPSNTHGRNIVILDGDFEDIS